MLFYYLFWMITGFIIHFYINFGTNLLTGGPAQICCFMPISVFRGKGISNGVQTEWNLRQRDFFGRISSWRLGVHVRRYSRSPGDRGRAPPTGRGPLSRGPLEHPPTDFFHLYNPTYPKTIRNQDRSGVPPPQASVATKNLLGACSGTLPEGESITGGHLHHPDAIHDEEGVVHPRGWGYVPVAMCLISLSLSCSLYGTILMYPELFYYIWILWCFSPSTLL